MSRRTQFYTGDKVSSPAAQCLQARLFVSGWDLSSTLKRFRDNPRVCFQLAVLREDQKPVAVAIFDGSQVMAFCRKDKRRNGFASRCVKRLELPATSGSWYNREPFAMQGIEVSRDFWIKNDVYVI